MTQREPWDHRRAGSALRPFEIDWRRAQEWCNFVLLRPGWLPPDLRLSACSIRPEAPPTPPGISPDRLRPSWTRSNRAVARYLLRGRWREIRVKQFLYDYAPPAFDHPGLWKSRSVHPFEVGSDIGWLGIDFRGRDGAAVTIDQTTVELSVLAGSVSARELAACCRGLAPVSPAARSAILATPLSRRCYQARHREEPIVVPVGYWRHERKSSHRLEVMTTPTIPEPLSHLAPAGAAIGSYSLRCAFVFSKPDGEIQEVDWVYQHRELPGSSLRLLSSPAGAAGGLAFPPHRERRQPCSTAIHAVRGQRFFHAYADERYGQHEVAWRQNGLHLRLLVKPRPVTGSSWLMRLLESILE